MSVYLLQTGVDARKLGEVEARLKQALPDLRRIASVEAIKTRAAAEAAGRFYVLIVAPSTEPDYFSKLVATISQYPGAAFFILISGDISASHYKQLVRSGNADWASEAGLPKEVLDIIARVDKLPLPEPAARDRPLVTSFVPSAGGVGNSTLAIETAVQLARRKGSRDGKVCLVDLDFQTSHVCDYLDIEPLLRIEEIAGAPDRLDHQLLNSFISHHGSGLDVLAAARSGFREREISVELLSSLFDLLAQRYAEIVIDLPLARHPWTSPVLAASQGVLVTGRNTIPGLRQIAETLEAIREETAITAAVRAVINDCEVNLIGRFARLDHVERVLGPEKPFLVAHSDAAVECVNAGTPMTIARRSEKAVKDIGAIARFCAELKPAAATARG